MTDKEDLITRLRNTASKGISVWGDLMLEAAKEIETLKAERECYASSMDRMLSSQRTEQEPAAFAGIEMWIGNARIKRLMTQPELHYANDPWAIMKFYSDRCIDALKESDHV
jgi:hypothetical protein